jgi:dTDP-4-amino-4,6-dideoxygalactose transaminase
MAAFFPAPSSSQKMDGNPETIFFSSPNPPQKPMNNIPLVDLKAQLKDLDPQIRVAMDRVIENTAFILGEDVNLFEQEFANYSEVLQAVGVASGLDALRLALRAQGIGHGDEVITVANTFIATALAITSIGAVPVLVDAREEDYNLDPELLESAITARTRAIIPVHLYGHPAAMSEIMAIAKRHDLAIIEDASQAHGARYRGLRVGSIGDYGAFSLYPGKNLGAFGDAGIITTGSKDKSQALKTLRNYGCVEKYCHDMLGENSRLDTLQAAVLRVKLAYLDRWNAARRKIAVRYCEALRDIEGLQLPQVAAHVEHVFHQYVLQVEDRDAMVAYLHENGIYCGVHYPVPVHLHRAYANSNANWRRGQFPVAERLAGRVLSLPMFPEMTRSQIETVVGVVDGFFSRQLDHSR